jgi:mono/diheme cytochrome c family protein
MYFGRKRHLGLRGSLPYVESAPIVRPHSFRRYAIPWMAARGAVLFCIFAQLSLGSDGKVSTSDGIFTFEQARHGEKYFAASCAICHGTDLAGATNAPSLAGDSFLQRWQGHSVGELFTRISLTMPKEHPHSLTDGSYADIVAFILDANGFPPSKTELKPDASTLNQVAVSQP